MDYPDGDLAIDRDGLAKLDEWRKHANPDDADRVAELLVDISKRRWQGLYWAQPNTTQPDVTTIQACEGVWVDVRLWADVDQFSIEGFSDAPPEEENGED